MVRFRIRATLVDACCNHPGCSTLVDLLGHHLCNGPRLPCLAAKHLVALLRCFMLCFMSISIVYCLLSMLSIVYFYALCYAFYYCSFLSLLSCGLIAQFCPHLFRFSLFLPSGMHVDNPLPSSPLLCQFAMV